MELTIDWLKEHGFDTNHPDKVLAKWYKTGNENGLEYRLKVEPEYVAGLVKVIFNVNLTVHISNNRYKTISVTDVDTVEELLGITNLVSIKLT